MGHCPDEWPCCYRRRLVALQDRLKRKVRAIHRPRVVLILRKHSAIQIDAGEKPLAPRIRQKLRNELPVGTSLSISAHRSSRSGGVSADLEFILQHVLKAL